MWTTFQLASVPIAAVISTGMADRGADPAEAVGYFIGMMLLPILIALAAVGFKPRRKLRTFSTVFCCVGLLGAAATMSSTLRDLSSPRRTPRELVQEALGTKPAPETGSLAEREMGRLVREFIGYMRAARSKHDTDAAAVAPFLANLYTAQSFSSVKEMQNMIGALKQTREIDQEMAQKVQRMPQDLKARVDASRLNASDKEDFMRGVQRGYASSDIIKIYGEVGDAEERWVVSSIDLYSFALQHASGIKTSGNRILIADQKLMGQFNEKLHNSRDLRKKLHEANQRLFSAQAAAMQNMGITNGDLGLK
jgi:hypothetical protein